LLPPSSLIALMKEAASTSETSVNFYQTRRNIPEESHLLTRRRENLNSHQHFVLFECMATTYSAGIKVQTQ
jgi:hypothetical protein